MAIPAWGVRRASWKRGCPVWGLKEEEPAALLGWALTLTPLLGGDMVGFPARISVRMKKVWYPWK